MTLGWPALPERWGRAKSRWRVFSELAGGALSAAGLVALADFAEPLPELSPAVAGVVGAESSGVWSLKSLEESLCWRGTGCVAATEPRWA